MMGVLLRFDRLARKPHLSRRAAMWRLAAPRAHRHLVKSVWRSSYPVAGLESRMQLLQGAIPRPARSAVHTRPAVADATSERARPSRTPAEAVGQGASELTATRDPSAGAIPDTATWLFSDSGKRLAQTHDVSAPQVVAALAVRLTALHRRIEDYPATWRATHESLEGVGPYLDPVRAPQALGGLLELVTQSYNAIRGQLSDDFSRLDPLNDTPPPTSVEATWAAESRFITMMTATLKASQHRLLSKQEHDVCETLQPVISLPVEADWSKVSSGLTDVVNPYEARGLDPPDFADKMFLFYRGLGVQRRTGFYYSDKIDLLYHRARNAVVSALLPGRLNDRWRQRMEEQAALPEHLQREGLADIPMTPANLLGRVTLVEPTAKSVVLLHRVVERPASSVVRRARWRRAVSNKCERAAKRLQAAADNWSGVPAATAHAGAVIFNSLCTRLRSANACVSEAEGCCCMVCLTSRTMLRDLRAAHCAESGDLEVPLWGEAPVGGWAHDGQEGTGVVVSAHRNGEEGVHTGVGGWHNPALQPHPILQQGHEAAHRTQKGRYDWVRRVRVYMKQYRDVPLCDLELGFPDIIVKTREIDQVKLLASGVVIVAMGAKLATMNALSTGAAVAAWSLGVVMLRMFYRYRVAKVYLEHRAISDSVDNWASAHYATMSTVVNEAADTDAKAVVVTYAALVELAHSNRVLGGKGWVPVADIQSHCEKVAEDVFGETIHIKQKVKALHGLGVAELRTNRHGVPIARPLPAKQTVAALKQDWKARFPQPVPASAAYA